MKKNKNGKPPAAKRSALSKPAKTTYPILRQLVQWIPEGLVQRLALKHKLDIRKFSANSHVVALLFAQIALCDSLNTICDAARQLAGAWRKIRGAEPPCRNTFSNANRTRDPKMAEDLFWEVYKHLSGTFQTFTQNGPHKGFIFRFRHRIFAIDSTTLQLALNCIDWAKHRRKKAAAKTHLRLDVGCRLPAFAIVETAAHHDSLRADELCAGLRDGDILLGDRAYTDFAFMRGLHERGVFFVLRAKRNMKFKTVRRLDRGMKQPDPGAAGPLADRTVTPALPASRALCGGMTLRLVRARVEVDGKFIEMEFLTNNLEWAPRSVAELYRARWAIELFFKELKQTCQLQDFVGYNENAVRWQVWTALLAHLLLRFVAYLSKWRLSFSRLVGIVRHTLWVNRNLAEMLRCYGTAAPPGAGEPSSKRVEKQGYFPFYARPYGTATF